MNKVKKFVSIFAAIIFSLCFLFNIDYTNNLSYASYDDCNDDWLHVKNSRIYDKDENEVWLTGANWLGFNGEENCGYGLWSMDIDDFLKDVSTHGFNVIHVPVSTELLLSWKNNTPLEVSSVTASNNEYLVINPEFLIENNSHELKNSMEIFDIIMNKMKDYGLKVIVGIASPSANISGEQYGLWYYEETAGSNSYAIGNFSEQPITWEDWIESLAWLAEKYSNDDTIIGYDLKETPHGEAKWDNSGDFNNWAYSARICADSILDVNPNALIFIEGISNYTDPDTNEESNAYYGANLRGVKNFPIKLKHGTSQLVYSTNDFGYLSAFPDYKDYWYDSWAFINYEEISPLYMSKWGDCDITKSRWTKALIEYMINNHVSHSYWSLSTNNSETDGLYEQYTYGSWNEEVYEMVRPTLWQTQGSEDGEPPKFISLDHKRALSGNSISVSDYYNKYAFTEGSNLDGGTIVIPDGITCIYSSDLDKNANFSSITLPDSLIEISNDTFFSVSDRNLKDIFFKGSKEEWESINIGYGNVKILNAKVHFMKSSDNQLPSIEQDEITLPNGEQYVINSNQNNLIYKSNNTDVAVVSKSGVVTAVGVGSAIISIINEEGDVIQLKVKVTKASVTGDCNLDGQLNISDIVLLQKWLLAVPDAELANWKAADLCEDGILNVFDLCMMKRELISK